MKHWILIAVLFLVFPHIVNAACSVEVNFGNGKVTTAELQEVSVRLWDSNIVLNGTIVPFGSLPSFTLNGSILNLNPLMEEYGLYNALVVVYDSDGCFAVQPIDIKVHAIPRITGATPNSASVEVPEGGTFSFSINVSDPDSEQIILTWFVDGVKAGSNTSFSFSPSYSMAGEHNVTVIAKDDAGYTSAKSWKTTVTNTNRRPILMLPLPEPQVYTESDTALFRLSRYFVDPDGEPLTFSVIYGDQRNSSVRTTQFKVQADADGKVSMLTTKWTGKFQMTFEAEDPYGARARSNTVITSINKYELGSGSNATAPATDNLCGDNVCSFKEDCSSCEEDCGLCGGGFFGCQPAWNCTVWSTCIIGKRQTRDCVDVSKCDVVSETPETSRICSLPASCFDGKMNGLESGVDCGGECDACPTCNDRIINQEETGIDCGGPCPSCASCSDEFKNGLESDIDCGGSCTSCLPGQNCDANTDCSSLVCRSGLCQVPSCQDGTRNQDEKGIDCEGSCEVPCPTCIDGIMNQNERGVDCGGFCSPCASCSDGIKNQGEKLTDCGGPCSACTIKNLPIGHWWIGILILLFVFSGWLFLRKGISMNSLLVVHKIMPMSKREHGAVGVSLRKALDRLAVLENDPQFFSGREPYHDFHAILEDCLTEIGGMSIHAPEWVSAVDALPYSGVFRAILKRYKKQIDEVQEAHDVIVPSMVVDLIKSAKDVLETLLREA
ncbi:MAG: hypothetical protein ABIA93_03905 [Candidatus Woesearchaeota archaeon]